MPELRCITIKLPWAAVIRDGLGPTEWETMRRQNAAILRRVEDQMRSGELPATDMGRHAATMGGTQ